MKQKYLLSMLLGGALLTACSVDDDLNLANVAQDVNPSAPVFTVSFENGGNALTRATFNNGQLTYQDAESSENGKDDLLSLYHGIQNGSFTSAYQNAIYAPKAGAADGTLVWKTNSMVLGGTAVMMYPANTKAQDAPGWTSAPVASVGATQTEASMTQLPYVSAGLEIKATGGKAADKNEAGYAKEYDIKMKPLASIVRLGLNENLKELEETLAGIVDEFEITGVTLKSTSNGAANKIFTTNAPITLTSVTAPTAHKTWTYKVGVDVTANSAGKSEKISTEWIPEEGGTLVANLPLLPFVATGTPTLGDLELAVETTFGTVYIASKNAENKDNKVVSHPYFKDNANIDKSATKAVQKKLENFIKDAKKTEKLTLNEAFEKIVEPVVDDQTLGSANFPGEYAGQSIQLAVDVDLNDVDLREMHLKTSKELITAIKVYNALKKTYDAKFYLDGGKEVANTFVMTDEALDLVMDQIKLGDKNKIQFIPCASHNGKVIRLDNEDHPAKEIPDLLLTMDENVTSVPVELAGAWKFKGEEDATKAIKLLNIQSLTVLKDATLNLDSWIQTANIPAKDNTPAVTGGLKGTASNANGIIVNKGGAVNVAGRAILKVNVENSGDIYIGGTKENTTNSNAELYIGGDVKLTNNAAAVNSKKNWAEYWKESGNIWNHGSLGVMSEATETLAGEIINYGVITVKSEDAVTYVTKNAEVEATADGGAANVAVEYSASNRVGSIVLYDVDGSKHNTKVGNKKAQGFIKYTISSGKVSSTTVGDVANYIIVENGITGDIEKITGVGNSKVKYIEFDGVNNKNIKTNTFDAIVVDANSKVTVPENETLTLNLKALYLKGTMRFSGILAGNWNLHTSIFGSSTKLADDKDDVTGLLVNTGEGKIISGGSGNEAGEDSAE